MTTMTSADFKAAVEPILNEIFDGIFDARKDEWKQVFSEETGPRKSYKEENVLYAFGAAPELPEGQAVTYQSGGQLFTKRYTFKVYGLAFAITRVLQEDGEAISVGSTFSKHLARSLLETKETLLANHLNRAFNASYIGGDGVPLISDSHPIHGGVFSNKLTAAALSQTSLEQAVTQLRFAVDNNGKRIRLDAKKLVVPPALEMTAEVLLKTPQRTGNNFNDVNPVVTLKKVSEGHAVISRMTSSTNWFLQTDAHDGLKLIMRRKLEKSMEGDFETDSMRYKSTERYGSGWTEPRCMWGNEGA